MKKKLGLLAMVLGIGGVLGVASFSNEASAAGGACKRTTFKTELVKDACTKGGQKAAKAAMKSFLKEHKKKDPSLDCKTCHKKLSPDYPLKPDALKKFHELGGK
jgi:hypothetical protein